MNRRALVAAAALSLLIAAPLAWAQDQVQRKFPADALRGTLVVEAAPEITLNGNPTRLAPGARIRGVDNMLAMSGSLTGLKLLVHYTLDMQGQVRDVWILTADEAARRPWPTTPEQAASWSFDAAAQTWTRN